MLFSKSTFAPTDTCLSNRLAYLSMQITYAYAYATEWEKVSSDL